MRMDLSHDKLQQVFVTLFELVKMKKRHSSIIMGKLREGNYISCCNNGSFSHLWTWHLSAFHSNSWVFILSPSRSTFMSRVTPLSHFKECLVFCCIMSWYLVTSVFPSIRMWRSMFKGNIVCHTHPLH